MAESGVTVFDFLRHGQVATSGLFSAPANEPLGSIGWKQLDLVTQHRRWDAVVTSPSRRCYDFARYAAQRMDSELTLSEGLDELNFGAWIGLSPEQVWERDPELIQYWWNQPMRFRAPDGESMDHFIQRVRTDWQLLQDNFKDQHVLVITHATAMRVVLADVLQIPFVKTQRLHIDYANISRVHVYESGEMELRSHGLIE